METQQRILRSASGYYDADLYEPGSESGGVDVIFIEAQRRKSCWNTLCFGPECILTGEAAPSVNIMHSNGSVRNTK